MKFRNEANLKAKVITASTAENLERELNNLGKNYDIIDLQYSTTGEFNNIEYSALALVVIDENKR